MDLTQYQKKTELEHIKDTPDMYIGSIEKIETNQWSVDNTTIVQKTQQFCPGLLKLFDEIIVNARDQTHRSKTPVTYIECTIQDGVITITNDGDGIDIAEHPEYKIYIPELIFGHLRTSTNYDKTEKKIVGGKNGYGAKLVFIWSEYAILETVDAIRGLKYTQRFSDNLSTIGTPTIVPYKKKSYTTITFKPDYKRLHMDGLTEDMQQLFVRRLYDIAAVTDKKTKVWYNGSQVPVNSFSQYVDLYIGKDAARVSESHPRWEVIIAMSDKFRQTSFVNGIDTWKGGKHVDYIVNQVLRKLVSYIGEKKKIEVKPSTLKEYLHVFIQCSIENPSFDSQSKDYLSTPSFQFGSTCDISDKTIEKLIKMGLMDVAIALTQKKDLIDAKRNDGSKRKKVRGIVKLVDAVDAGTDKSESCTLIICEGDSAKAGILSGLSQKQRLKYGLYPLKGKPMNVRDDTINLKKINANKEIDELKQILGLEVGYEYTPENIKRLRYGKLLIATDQDLDGSHIKGLCINIFDTLWPSLLHQTNFIGFINTPIIKARKSSQEVVFYNDGQYDAWKQTNPVGWTIKYYKGLGTSTAEEFKRILENVEEKIVFLKWGDESKDKIDMAFNKKRAGDRKEWLTSYVPEYLNTDVKQVFFEDFITKELKHFSKEDCDRSIGCMVDGFKTSQRKIWYGVLKRNLVKEVKVAQLSGYVSEHSAYHHGEQSLNGTIVSMAQEFVGSNNLNLLKPNGQFGTRLQGGADHASERYIQTQLKEYARFIFPTEDDAILHYLKDDGIPVEPNYYLPIIPMILVNGCRGIGTGFSTFIPCYNPIEIIDYLIVLLNGETIDKEFIPYYRGFKGTITSQDGKYLCKGVYTVKDNTVHVTELPIGKWTDDYKEFLEESLGTLVKDYTDQSTDTLVDFQIKMNSIDDIERTLKLTTTLSISNMNLFTEKDQIKKYSSVQEIIHDFYQVRLEGYKTRKEHVLKSIQDKLRVIHNKVQYIRALLEDRIDLRKKNTTMIIQELKQLGLDDIDGYSYLIKMPMDSVSIENVTVLEQEYQSMIQKVKDLTSTPPEQLWLSELNDLKKQLVPTKLKIKK
jgi:DNA topoisomerase-2